MALLIGGLVIQCGTLVLVVSKNDPMRPLVRRSSRRIDHLAANAPIFLSLSLSWSD